MSDARSQRKFFGSFFTRERLILAALCAALVVLELPPILQNSYVYNENGRLASGLLKLRTGDFSSFRVNPPLADCVAAIPAALDPDVNAPTRNDLKITPFGRIEYEAGDFFVEHNPNHLRFLRLGRLCELPFAILGALACYFYARWLFGKLPGVAAVLLWIFSPYVNGHGATIGPDLPSAALAIATCGLFHYWLKTRDSRFLFYSGVALGLAELSKLTLLALYPILFLLWLVYPAPQQVADETSTRSRKRPARERWRETKDLFLYCFALSVLIVNMGYLFEDSFRPLGKYRFQTTLFTGKESLKEIPPLGLNRFSDGVLGKLPVPLPKNYVLGIDTQRLDFERGFPSYWNGKTRKHGCVWFYAYALLIKTPLGRLALLAIALLCMARFSKFRLKLCDEAALWTPGLALLLFVSSQTGFSLHSRYVLPALPFFFVAVSRLARLFERTSNEQTAPTPRQTRRLRALVAACALWALASFLWIYPHELSYFNELTPLFARSVEPPTPPDLPSDASYWTKVKRALDAPWRLGPRCLIDSNVDWGQDATLLNDFLRERPDVDRLGVALTGNGYVLLRQRWNERVYNADEGARGWIAVGVTRLYGNKGTFRPFLKRKPEAIVGATIYLYYVPYENEQTSDKEDSVNANEPSSKPNEPPNNERTENKSVMQK